MKFICHFLFIIITLNVSHAAFSFSADTVLPAKHPSTLKEFEDTLKVIGPKILQSQTDSARTANNQIFTYLLKEALQLPNSFEYPFDSLKNVSVRKSDDNVIKSYTWTRPEVGSNNYSFFGFIQVNNKKKKLTTLIELEDKHEEIQRPETQRLDAKNWYGSLYYQILTDKYRKKTTYTLIGWHGNNRKSTKKVIDVLNLNNNRISFGAPVFKVGNKTQSRMIYEYNAQAVMSLKFEDRKNMIVMDHLSPASPALAKLPESYGPDFTYDAFRFKKGKWHFQRNIDINNPASSDPKVKSPPQTDKIPPVGQ